MLRVLDEKIPELEVLIQLERRKPTDISAGLF